MNIIKRSATGLGVFVFGLGLLAAGGCTAKRPATKPASQPMMTMHEKSQHRLTDLREAVAGFQEQANSLPGSDDAEHRQIMDGVFDNLSVALPILVGPEPSGAFRLQMRSLRSAREELANNPNLAPEPIEDSGLRAAVAAMSRISHEEFYGESGNVIDKLRLSLRPLDRTTGPMHRLAVRDVVRQMADELRRLADKYEDRVEGGKTRSAE